MSSQESWQETSLDIQMAEIERDLRQESTSLSEGYDSRREVLLTGLEERYSEGAAETVGETIDRAVEKLDSDEYDPEDVSETFGRAMDDIRYFEKLKKNGYPWKETEELPVQERNKESNQALRDFREKQTGFRYAL